MVTDASDKLYYVGKGVWSASMSYLDELVFGSFIWFLERSSADTLIF